MTVAEIISTELATPEPVYTTNIHLVMHYSDGTQLQLDRDVTWGNLKRDGLEAVEVYKKDSGLVFQMFLEPDKKLIYTRRTVLDTDGNVQAFYIIGWRKNIGGEDVQSINIIHENIDTIQQLQDFRNSVPFHAVDREHAEK